MLSDSGTLTLETKDTICEDDIEVEYTKPAISMPIYMKKPEDPAPTLITTYSGNGNTLLDIDIHINSDYTVSKCVLTNIEAIPLPDLVEFPYVFDGVTMVTIPVVNIKEIDPLANSVLIMCGRA